MTDNEQNAQQSQPQGQQQYYQYPPNFNPTIVINNTNTNTIGYAPIVQKKKSTALILCLLGFIGFAGLHRFYTGKPLSGLIFLLTIGLCFIGTVWDLIMILIGSFRDKSGQPLV